MLLYGWPSFKKANINCILAPFIQFSRITKLFFSNTPNTVYIAYYLLRNEKKLYKGNHSQVFPHKVIPLKLERATKRMKVGEKSS